MQLLQYLEVNVNSFVAKGLICIERTRPVDPIQCFVEALEAQGRDNRDYARATALAEFGRILKGTGSRTWIASEREQILKATAPCRRMKTTYIRKMLWSRFSSKSDEHASLTIDDHAWPVLSLLLSPLPLYHAQRVPLWRGQQIFDERLTRTNRQFSILSTNKSLLRAYRVECSCQAFSRTLNLPVNFISRTEMRMWHPKEKTTYTRWIHSSTRIMSV